MCNERNDCDSCIAEILRKILMLQREDCENDNFAGCDKPFLGPNCTSMCYNTRPIQLFNCCTGEPWSFPITVNGETFESDIFRVEALDECCCTCRLLYRDPSTTELINTGEFATIDLNCVGAIRCLADTFIELC